MSNTIGPSPIKRDERPVVLVIDDDTDLRLYIHRRLASLCSVEQASNARVALSTAAVVSPMLVLLDLGLPDMDGLELLGRLRAIPHMASVPVLLMTGRGQHHITQELIPEGTGLIAKPFDARTLRERVSGALGLDGERG